MITARVEKNGQGLVLSIPADEIERLGLVEGQLVAIEVRPVEVRPTLAPDLREAFEASWERNQEGYRYLAGR
jgi:antitoxin component of MazEF toxin-antitoxin module